MTNASRLWLVAAGLTIVFGGVCFAETYHLSPGGDWQNVADTPEGNYLLAISKIKQQIQTGDDAAVMEALEKLKSDFPELAGKPIEAYIEAEQFYGDGKLYTIEVKSQIFPVIFRRVSGQRTVPGGDGTAFFDWGGLPAGRKTPLYQSAEIIGV